MPRTPQLDVGETTAMPLLTGVGHSGRRVFIASLLSGLRSMVPMAMMLATTLVIVLVIAAPFFVINMLTLADAPATESRLAADIIPKDAGTTSEPMGKASVYDAVASDRLREARSIVEDDLTKVMAAQAAAPTKLESVINEWTALTLGGLVRFYVPLVVIGGLIVFSLYASGRLGHMETYRRPRRDDLPPSKRWVGFAAGMLGLIFILGFTPQVMELFNVPNQKAVELGAFGGNQRERLPIETYKRLELDPFAVAMYGANDPEEVVAGRQYISKLLAGEPVAESDYRHFTELYNRRVADDGVKQRMGRVSFGMQVYALSKNAPSQLVAAVQMGLRPFALASFLVVTVVMFCLTILRPGRFIRNLKFWAFLNGTALVAVVLNGWLLSTLNWGSLRLVTELAGESGSNSTWWLLGALGLLVGVISIWLIFLLYYLALRFARNWAKRWLIEVMLGSESSRMRAYGQRLKARPERPTLVNGARRVLTQRRSRAIASARS